MNVLPHSFLRSLGAGIVALMVLFPKTTHAEAVEDFERMGESDEDGQRFGALVVKGELVATANGYSLVRTYENKSDAPVEMVLEERVDRTETMAGARVTPPEQTVLSRTQKIRLGPNEKKSVGTYLPEKLGREIRSAHRVAAWVSEQMMAGKPDGERTYHDYRVFYLRALAPGETAAVHEPEEGAYVATRPARMMMDAPGIPDEERPGVATTRQTIEVE